jgi:hypothetical protein
MSIRSGRLMLSSSKPSVTIFRRSDAIASRVTSISCVEEALHLRGGLALGVRRQPQPCRNHGPALDLPAEQIELAFVLALTRVAHRQFETVDPQDLHGRLADALTAPGCR